MNLPALRSSVRGGLLVVLCVLGSGALGSSSAGCGGNDPPVSERSVAGYVTTSMGDGIDGATVTFVGDTLYTAEARTDDEGFYELRVETDSPFGQVRATHPDYQPAEATVFFDTDERRVDLVLRR